MARTTHTMSILAAALAVVGTIAAPPRASACDKAVDGELVLAALEDPTPAPEAEAPSPPEAPRAKRRAPRISFSTPSALTAPTPPTAPTAPVAPLQMAPSRVLPRGWFGFGLQCDACSATIQPNDTLAVWVFGSRPRVYSVEQGSPAARAGIQRGDEITHIDGVSIMTEEGGRRFSVTRPGQVVRWTLSRQGTPRHVAARALERPERRAQNERREQMENLRAEAGRLSHIQDIGRLRAEIERLNARIEQYKVENSRPSLLSRRAPGTPRPLRYAGVIGATEVEVRGSGSVIVSENENKDELVINTGESVVVIKKTDKKRD